MTKTPSQIGQELLKVVANASGTKKRHDAILLELSRLQQTTNFNMSVFVDFLSRKLKDNEGLILSYEAYRKLFGNKPTNVDIEFMQTLMTPKDISVNPLYKNMDGGVIATFIVIHRKLYRAMELADELRVIITGEPLHKNPKAWLVGTAIKISEELGQLLSKAKTIYKQDILDALNILRGDEVYYISYNFCLLNKLDPRDLIDFLGSKHFYVDKLISDVLREQETNPDYKDIAEIAGLLVSRTEVGIGIGRQNLEILFKCSESIDSTLVNKGNEPSGSVH